MKVQVGNKTLTISKWKGKNKKEFIKCINENNQTSQVDNDSKIKDILVYSCINEDVILTPDEFRYVLSRIRAYSLGEDITINFYCPKCGETFEKIFQIKDIIKPEYKKLTEIKVDDLCIKIGDIKNKDIFYEKIKEDNIYELLFKVKSFNDNDTFNLEELEELFDSLDIDILEKVLEIYEEHRFKIDDINSVECECGNTMIFEFDELPGFFPENWFE